MYVQETVLMQGLISYH